MKTPDKKNRRFIKGYCDILQDKKLAASEKLVYIAALRYGPKCTQTNDEIAKAIGLSGRTVQTLLFSLWFKGYIERGYADTIKNGKHFTCRAIVPVDFSAKIQWVKKDKRNENGLVARGENGLVGGTRTYAKIVRERSRPTKENIENIKEKNPPTPSPSEQRASAGEKTENEKPIRIATLAERQAIAKKAGLNLKNQKDEHKPLPADKFQNKRQKTISNLFKAEGIRKVEVKQISAGTTSYLPVDEKPAKNANV